MRSKVWRWVIGLIYIVAVAMIWITASFVVQSVVDAGVSPFLITYICNSLFIVYIPVVEIGRFIEDRYGSLLFWRASKSGALQEVGESEQTVLLDESDSGSKANSPGLSSGLEEGEIHHHDKASGLCSEFVEAASDPVMVRELVSNQVDEKGRWTRTRVAKVSLLICPFWFLAQLTFNLSLKYTTVTVSIFLLGAILPYRFCISRDSLINLCLNHYIFLCSLIPS